jgi:hypothetical protein
MMKNKLLMLAGLLAVPALVGALFATPSVAQSAGALLVKNVDEKGRTPYMEIQHLACATGQACQIFFPPVPDGKRLVVEHINATVSFADSGIRIAGLLMPTDGIYALPVHSAPPPNPTVVNESALVFFESGQTPTFHLITNDDIDRPLVIAILSGYLVNLEQ